MTWTKRSVAIILVCIDLTVHFSLQQEGGTLTSGFPSLDEIRGNGSLLSDGVFTTHDGEIRSVPDMQFTCNGSITKLTFIALPGVGISTSVFIVVGHDGLIRDSISTEATILNFGDFGYELSTDDLRFQNGDTLYIAENEANRLRILYQVDDKELDICWRWLGTPGNDSCGLDYDYPLLAVETDPPGCVEGSLSVTMLKNMWENRTRPVLYSSPDRDIVLDCSGPGSLSEILIGAYITGTGDVGPRIMINGTDICDLSTLHATEHLNVYKCTPEPDVEIGVGSTLHITQRNGTSLISFLHDGQTDTPLISVITSGQCSFSGFLSEDDLREKTALHIPNFPVVEIDYILFEHLNITQDGYLTKWIFTAEDLGEGDGRTEYPDLAIIRSDIRHYVTAITLHGSDAVLTNYSNVYEFTLQNAMKVQAGDFIGIMLPLISNARLLLYFVQNGGPVGLNLRRKKDVEPVSGREGALPLVTLEIFPTPVSSTILDMKLTPFIISKSDTPSLQSNPQVTLNPATSSPPATLNQDADYWQILVISAIVTLIIVTATAMSCCVIYWLRKRKRDLKNVTNNSQNEDVILDSNPSYHTVTAANVVMKIDESSSSPSSSYQTVVPISRKIVDITTSVNEAYVLSKTSVNVSYQSVQTDSDDTLEYDYIRPR